MSLIMSILMKYLVLVSMINATHSEIQPVAKCMANKPPVQFYGKMMKSENLGETWESINEGLSKDFSIRSMGIDGNKVYVGSTEARLYSKDVSDNQWASENLEDIFINQVFNENNFVSGIYPTKSGTFAHVINIGLLKKSVGKTLWLPLPIPEEIRFINDVKEDDLGNIYVSCPEGIFVTEDEGTNWTRIYMTSWVGDMFIQNNSIVSNAGKDIIMSADRGTTWKRISINSFDAFHFSADNSSFSVMPFGNGIAALRSEWPSKDGPGKFLVSNDGGKTWKRHEADQYLNQLEDVTSVVEFENKIFCSYKEGVITSDDQGKTWKFLLKYQKDNNGPLLLLKIHNGILYCWEGVFGC